MPSPVRLLRARRWLPAPAVSEEDARALAAGAELPLPVARLLHGRGLSGAEEARAFLSPSLATLSPPTGLPGLDEAVARVTRALAAGEGIMVHGDYDVDGLSATALLLRFLRRRGARVSAYIPHRLAEGYGLAEAGVRACRERGATLLLTADCGTRSHAEVERARELGIDCVVTDHHGAGAALPRAVAVVNPVREGSDPAHRDLAGVGVALRLVQALAEKVGEGPEGWQADLDLVALGTIADIVPLRGDNRVLAAEGLVRLAATDKIGLRALMDVAGVRPAALGGWHVAFVLAPRLNAAGRLGMADRALDLLLTEDAAGAEGVARTLERENQSRQKLDQQMQREAEERVELELDLADTWAITLASPRWHRGVVGIVASRLVERYGRPAILLGTEGGEARGSGRSIPGFDLAAALDEVGEVLTTHGGHPMAAGLSLPAARVPELAERLNEIARRRLTGADLERRFRLDVEATLGELTPEVARALRRLEPHGHANPRPLFAARGVSLASTPAVLKGTHLRLRVRQGEAVREAVAFGMASRLSELRAAGGGLDLAFEATEDTWRGSGAVELVVRDFLPAGDPRGGSAP